MDASHVNFHSKRQKDTRVERPGLKVMKCTQPHMAIIPDLYSYICAKLAFLSARELHPSLAAFN